MSKKIPHIAEKIVTELRNALVPLLGDNLIKIVLFGSYANLDYSHDSDIDIIILTKDNESEQIDLNEQINTLCVDLSLKYGVVISVIIKNSKQFYEFSDILPFYNNIVTHGVTVYG
ncbi:MAG: nucleotidyltransferase domain-containing protein [Ignavibacteriales bacterium]|nr:nucleotidyltransferase domain-containing protein [Ignavibacteriales bacterium]